MVASTTPIESFWECDYFPWLPWCTPPDPPKLRPKATSYTTTQVPNGEQRRDRMKAPGVIVDDGVPF